MWYIVVHVCVKITHDLSGGTPPPFCFIMQMNWAVAFLYISSPLLSPTTTLFPCSWGLIYGVWNPGRAEMEPKEVAGGQLIAATGKRQGMPLLARKPSTWGSSTLANLVRGPRWYVSLPGHKREGWLQQWQSIPFFYIFIAAAFCSIRQRLVFNCFHQYLECFASMHGSLSSPFC